MKGFIILVIVLIIGFIIYAAGRKQEVEAQKKNAPAQNPAPVVQKEKKSGSNVVKEIGDAASYATGAAQVHAGNQAKNKVQQLENIHNAQQNKALENMD